MSYTLEDAQRLSKQGVQMSLEADDEILIGGAAAGKACWDPEANCWRPGMVPFDRVIYNPSAGAWEIKPEPRRPLRYKPSLIAHRP